VDVITIYITDRFQVPEVLFDLGLIFIRQKAHGKYRGNFRKFKGNSRKYKGNWTILIF
jgi:hypothetical protein